MPGYHLSFKDMGKGYENPNLVWQFSGTMERWGSVGSRELLSFQDSRDDPQNVREKFPTHGGSTQTGTTSGGNSRQLHRWEPPPGRGKIFPQ